MKSLIRFLVTASVVVPLAAPAAAQEKTDPDEITVGVARITLSMAYASVRVNGEEWEHSYFEDDGLLLVLEGMDRNAEYSLHLVPMEEEYRFVDAAVAPKDWKLARLDRHTRQWQFKKKIRFRKWKPGEREEWERQQREAEEKAAAEAEEKKEKPAEEPVKEPAEEPVKEPAEETAR